MTDTNNYSLQLATDLVHKMAYELWIRTPAKNRICEVGQTVAVLFPSNQPSIDCIGELISVEMIPVEDWNEEEEKEPAPEFKHWTIKTLDGRLVRWTNVSLLPLSYSGI